MEQSECSQSRVTAAQRVTWFGLVLNLVLGAIQVLVGYWCHSRALIADGVHSLSDLATDVAVLWGVRFAELPTDYNHHYGYYKATNLVFGFIAVGILFTSGMILIDSFQALFQQTSVVPH
jgi:cation diffusion facilitator family transporter